MQAWFIMRPTVLSAQCTRKFEKWVSCKYFVCFSPEKIINPFRDIPSQLRFPGCVRILHRFLAAASSILAASDRWGNEQPGTKAPSSFPLVSRLLCTTRDHHSSRDAFPRSARSPNFLLSLLSMIGEGQSGMGSRTLSYPTRPVPGEEWGRHKKGTQRLRPLRTRALSQTHIELGAIFWWTLRHQYYQMRKSFWGAYPFFSHPNVPT